MTPTQEQLNRIESKLDLLLLIIESLADDNNDNDNNEYTERDQTKPL